MRWKFYQKPCAHAWIGHRKAGTEKRFDFEQAIARWRTNLENPPAIRTSDLEELESHLSDSIQAQQIVCRSLWPILNHLPCLRRIMLHADPPGQLFGTNSADVGRKPLDATT